MSTDAGWLRLASDFFMFASSKFPIVSDLPNRVNSPGA
jgi:hypothetical protein